MIILTNCFESFSLEIKICLSNCYIKKIELQFKIPIWHSQLCLSLSFSTVVTLSKMNWVLWKTNVLPMK